MRMMPVVLRLLLALVVALTSVHTAVGRAEARGAMDLVICAEGGVATVSLDARGKPVVHLHGCPDCVLGGMALAGALPPVMAAPRRMLARVARARRGRLAEGAALVGARARGPPGAG